MNISYSFGMIDLLHFGHINALKKASENAVEWVKEKSISDVINLS
jgi:glycerol-3-phosphate cytidylyltransferase-like family protein